jgi:hydrogenase maturation protein HypF
MPEKINTWRIIINGIVQGVGFRPYVYGLASRMCINGFISNTSNGVVIEFNASANDSNRFYLMLLKEAPALSCITGHKLLPAKNKQFKKFEIRESNSADVNNLKVTPDFAMCESCSKEIFAPSNRRYHYPFTTCTNCGPRYSILTEVPFDRENTSMNSFRPCKKCRDEYNDPQRRRHHSQTNSCGTCGPELSFYDCAAENFIRHADLIKKAGDMILEGAVIAVKGIGGFILMVDATNEEAVKRLRRKKNRPNKPFALMYPDKEAVFQDYDVSTEEWGALLSPASPIVLLRAKSTPQHRVKYSLINNGLSRVGVMMPYAPVYALLMDMVKRPLVATSGNISSEPIVSENDDALEKLSSTADYLLMNNRDIAFPQDDSVVQFSGKFRQKIILRRSRGMAPNYLDTVSSLQAGSVSIAMGADMKNTFSILFSKNIILSQYLGDQGHYETQEAGSRILKRLLKMINKKPQHILIDKHPAYHSGKTGKAMADSCGCVLSKIQHHIAHLCAVLGENDLINTDHRVLGVVWDGVGYGDDGQIWGGEFFAYEKKMFQRVNHLPYFPAVTADKMSREPRISALALGHDDQRIEEHLKKKFTDEEWKIYKAILQKGDNIKSSSMGRLFDAVASLIGICDTNTYEGEAALYLQSLAEDYFKIEGYDKTSAYPVVDQGNNLNYRLMLNLLIDDLEKDAAVNELAAKFHLTLVEWIKSFALSNHFKHIAFSGGVFQNVVLVDLILYHLKKDFNLYFHRQLSSNDENISFGQLIFSHINS